MPLTPGKRPATVYFFGTCLVDLFDPEAGISAMDILERTEAEDIGSKAEARADLDATDKPYPEGEKAVPHTATAHGDPRETSAGDPVSRWSKDPRTPNV